MEDPNIDIMFMSMIYRKNISDFEYLDNYIQNKILSLRDSEDLSLQWGHCDTYSSVDDIWNVSNDDTLSPLIEMFKREVEYVSRTYYGFNDPKVSYSGTPWVNLAMTGGFQEFHVHAGAHFSIAYYVNVDDDSGNIIFKDSLGKQMVPFHPPRTDSPATYGRWIHKPKKHDLLIFRSHMEHMVAKNKSDIPRISLSSNYEVWEAKNDE